MIDLVHMFLDQKKTERKNENRTAWEICDLRYQNGARR